MSYKYSNYIQLLWLKLSSVQRRRLSSSLLTSGRAAVRLQKAATWKKQAAGRRSMKPGEWGAFPDLPSSLPLGTTFHHGKTTQPRPSPQCPGASGQRRRPPPSVFSPHLLMSRSLDDFLPVLQQLPAMSCLFFTLPGKGRGGSSWLMAATAAT